jgi:glycosyltransferase involved in cell wall biosynthesis
MDKSKIENKNKKFKIVIGSIFPFNESIICGGVEAVTNNLIKYFQKNDLIEWHVVSCNKNISHSFSEKRNKINFHWIRTNGRLNVIKAITINAWKVNRIYNKINPDLIHAQAASEYSVGAKKGIPLILTIHGLEIYNSDMDKIDLFKGPLGLYRREICKLINNISIKNASIIISIAGKYINKTLSDKIKNKKVVNIYNPINHDYFKINNSNNKKYKILCVGKLRESKNQNDIIESFSLIEKYIKNATLEFAGDGLNSSYGDKIKRTVNKYGLEKKIIFYGNLNETELIKLYMEASVIVSFSIQETAPMAILQAMAAGRPIIASEVGGIPYIVKNGKTGLLVKSKDIKSLADTILLLAKDKKLRKKLSNNARKYAKLNFDGKLIANNTIELYKHILK